MQVKGGIEISYNFVIKGHKEKLENHFFSAEICCVLVPKSHKSRL